MNEIIIKTQSELDTITVVATGVQLTITAALTLNHILSVFGKLSVNVSLNCGWDSRYVEAWGNSSVVAWGNSSVVARGNSSVVAWENSSVVARENSSVVAWGNSSVVARENSSVEARENSSVEARENTLIRLFSAIKAITLHDFSVAILPFNLKIKIKKEQTCMIQRFKPLPYLKREGVNIKNGKTILFKRVSSDWKTQKGAKNETIWTPGGILEHPKWEPEKNECGEGKYHACSRPYFCDEFRNSPGDRYIAIEIATKNLYEWPNPQYPHKIAFRQGKVLYECDKLGKKIKR